MKLICKDIWLKLHCAVSVGYANPYCTASVTVIINVCQLNYVAMFSMHHAELLLLLLLLQMKRLK